MTPPLPCTAIAADGADPAPGAARVDAQRSTPPPTVAVAPPIAPATAEAAAATTALAPWLPLIDALGEPAWLVEADRQQVCALNAEASALLGLTLEQTLGQAAESLLATPEDMAYWDDVRQGRLQPLDSEAVVMHPSGRMLRLRRQVRPVRGADGQVRHFLVRVSDRSVEHSEALAREQLLAELQATLESTADGILVTDLSGRIRGFNRRFAEIWGLPPSLLTQRQDEAVFAWMRRSVEDPDNYQRRLAALQEATLSQATERLTLHSGQVIERVTLPQRSRGKPCGRVWSFRDLTELVAAGQRIEALATTDGLTGLINRRQMTETLSDALRQIRRDNGTLALMLLDLDRFKQINDSLGQSVADRVLLEVADRLKNSLRQGEVVARVGGDQFAVLLHGADQRGVEAAARRLLEALSAPMVVDALPFTLTGSVGVAMAPADADEADVLLRHAESAMQRAKHSGRACVRFHQPRRDADLRERMRLDHAMRQALVSHRFRLHYQPQVALADGAVIGAEALIRWRDPELGDVSPGKFIPVAEETGFIAAIGDWVLGEAVRQAAEWRAAGLVMPVSVNVSALQFEQGDFQERVAGALREHGLPGELLELELTESVLVQDADDALARLSQLAALGVKLAIDDFGTGYSSLSYLKRFPIDRLKVDRSFVKGVPGGESDEAIVRAIVQLGQAMGMKVIAEGVETEAQRAFLQTLGCDEFQGWLYAPAMEAVDFVQRVQGQRQRRPRLSLVGR